jgi:AcrR family transcriptional regulator
MSDPLVPPARRSETGPALRRAILDWARHLLLSDGYQSLSLRKIAREVGCSATSIYLHFESKDALVHALIDEGMAALGLALEQADHPSAPPPERLRGLCAAYVRFGLDNPEYYQVMFQLHPARMARYPAENYRRARTNIERFAAVLEAGAAAGAFRVAPSADVAAHVLWTALHGLVSLRLAERIDVRLAGEAFVEAAIEQAVAGLRAA